MSVLRGLFVRKDATRGTTPVEARNALAAIFPSAGVVDGLAVSGNAGDWHYSVAAGHAVTSRGGTDGVTILTVDGATDTPVVAAAPASGSRWDLIWIRHNDVDNGDADSDAVLGVTQGTASGSPTKPYGSVPAGALVLAEAQVAAGATGTLHANVAITRVAAVAAPRGMRLHRWGVSGGAVAEPQILTFEGYVTTDADGYSTTLFNVAPVMSTLVGSPVAMGVSPGAGLTASLADASVSAVKLRWWIASSPIASQTFAVRITFFGVA